jgi:hypothetical protein
MFFYSCILEFLVDALSLVLHIDAVFGELIPPFAERIITAVWF